MGALAPTPPCLSEPSYPCFLMLIIPLLAAHDSDCMLRPSPNRFMRFRHRYHKANQPIPIKYCSLGAPYVHQFKVAGSMTQSSSAELTPQPTLNTAGSIFACGTNQTRFPQRGKSMQRSIRSHTGYPPDAGGMQLITGTSKDFRRNESE